MKKNLLSAAIASSLLLSAGVANAAFTITTNVSAPQNVANETTAAALSQQVQTVTAANPVIKVGAASDLVTGTGELRLVLSNGAKWNLPPAVTPTGAINLQGAGAATTTSAIIGNANAGVISADKKTVTYTVTAGTALTTDTLTIAIKSIPGLFDLTAVPTGTAVTMDVQAFDNATGSFSANGVSTKNLFSKVKLAKATIVPNTSAQNIANVAASPVFTAFIVGGQTTACNTTATTVKNNTSSQAILATDMTFSLKGDFSDITTITNAAATTSWTVNAAKTEATATLALSLNGGVTTGNICPTLTFSGTKVIPVSQYKLDIATKPTTGYVASTVVTAEPLITTTQNGSSFSTNSTGPLNSLKITDLSGRSSSNIIITAYNATGAVVPSTAAVVMPSAVAANATTVISGADLLANYPTGVRFDFVVQSSQVEVSNVKKTASGTNVTVYRNVVDTTAGQI